MIQAQTGCTWPGNDTLMMQYHDQEWGVPVHDDHKLFEFMVLDSFQAGLSWKTILHRRAHFANAFSGFDPVKIARYTTEKSDQLLQNPGIIRNRLKIQATISNAQRFLETAAQYGTFDHYIWGFTDGESLINRWTHTGQIPATSLQSDAMSKDLKKRGFKFCGSVICYAFMQAAGMVNDHLTSCHRHLEVQVAAAVKKPVKGR